MQISPYAFWLVVAISVTALTLAIVALRTARRADENTRIVESHRRPRRATRFDANHYQGNEDKQTEDPADRPTEKLPKFTEDHGVPNYRRNPLRTGDMRTRRDRRHDAESG